MSDRFWSQLSSIFGLMAIGILFGLIAFASSIEIKDLDLWLHLGTGRYIAANGYIPDHDVLSATISGKDWVNHEWLFQYIIYQIHHGFGFDGLIAMQRVVVVVTFALLLFLGYHSRRQLPIVFLLFLVLQVYQTRFTIRPDIYSLLFFVSYISILACFMERRWALYVLLALQVLWTNMHGFFFFGPVLVWLALLAEGIRRKVKLPWEWNATGRLSDGELARLGIAAILLPLACLLNPLGVGGALYPLGVFFQIGGESQIFFKHIVELQKPFTAATFFTGSYFHYKVLIIISAYSFIINRRRLDISVFLIWLIFLLFSMVAVRNIVFFAVVAYLVTMVNIAQVNVRDVLPFSFVEEKFKSVTGVAVKLVMMFSLLNFGVDISANGYFDFDTYQRKSEFGGVSKRNYPYKAVNFLVANKVKGNFFNDFNSGAYLVGRTHPHIKVFIDGRTEVYGSAFFKEYQKIWKEGDSKLFAEFERRYNITGALLNSTNQEIPKPVAKMFFAMKNWSVVYFDDDAMIFLKQTPQHKDLIARFAIDLNKWESPGIDLFKLGSKRIEPFPFTNRAHTLEALGLLEPARKEALWSLRVDPAWIPAYKLLGKVYGKQKNHRKAFEYFRIAVMFAPHDIENRSNLALAYEKLRDYKGMLEQFERMVELAPENPKGHFGLAKALALMGKSSQAIEALRAARKLDNKVRVDVKKIHDIIAKHNLSVELKNKLEEVVK